MISIYLSASHINISDSDSVAHLSHVAKKCRSRLSAVTLRGLWRKLCAVCQTAIATHRRFRRRERKMSRIAHPSGYPSRGRRYSREIMFYERFASTVLGVAGAPGRVIEAGPYRTRRRAHEFSDTAADSGTGGALDSNRAA